ncbi:peptidyl-prolyl cis-trans isomerase [Tsuneonella sp. SYSU-LHT278]|uniref:peptidylprolyl isomerase n=1 Tax=Tsuneonella sediminis TaxID=3416089 RepID=UPI003F78CBCD
MADSTEPGTRGLTLARLIREPLVHFLLLGAAIFAFLGWQGEPADPETRTIVLTREDQARLAANFAEIMGRPPSAAELDGVIGGWVRDEVLYREALRLGLDDGDAVIRKRLAQKMDAIAASAADAESPDEATLRKWLADHPERFAVDAALTFDQIFFTSRSRATVGKTLLDGGADWRWVGDPVSLPPRFERAGREAIARELGEEFARALDTLAPSKSWQGPIEGALGWHLVRLTERTPGKLPPFEAVRGRVEDDWRTATAGSRRDAAYKLLRDAYTVTIDK